MRLHRVHRVQMHRVQLLQAKLYPREWTRVLHPLTNTSPYRGQGDAICRGNVPFSGQAGFWPKPQFVDSSGLWTTSQIVDTIKTTTANVPNSETPYFVDMLF